MRKGKRPKERGKKGEAGQGSGKRPAQIIGRRRFAKARNTELERKNRKG